MNKDLFGNTIHQNDLPTEKQIRFLTKKKQKIPNTKKEATKLISYIIHIERDAWAYSSNALSDMDDYLDHSHYY